MSTRQFVTWGIYFTLYMRNYCIRVRHLLSVLMHSNYGAINLWLSWLWSFYRTNLILCHNAHHNFCALWRALTASNLLSEKQLRNSSVHELSGDASVMCELKSAMHSAFASACQLPQIVHTRIGSHDRFRERQRESESDESQCQVPRAGHKLSVLRASRGCVIK